MTSKYFIPEITERELETEEWRPVVGAGGFYSVSSLGRVRRDAASKMVGLCVPGKILKASPQRKKSGPGYLLITICVDGIAKTPYVHHLVATAFIGPRPPKEETNHKDANKWNNRISNLEYLPKEKHTKHNYDNDLWAKGNQVARAAATPEIVRAIRAEYQPGKTGTKGNGFGRAPLVAKYGLSASNVHDILRRRTWKHID